MYCLQRTELLCDTSGLVCLTGRRWLLLTNFVPCEMIVMNQCAVITVAGHAVRGFCIVRQIYDRVSLLLLIFSSFLTRNLLLI
jgi:hypothetical protein